MKQHLVNLFVCLVMITPNLHAQNVGVGTNTPDASAMLDISSSNKGVLIPRMDSATRKTIPSPAVGLLVYDNNTASFWYYANAQWNEIIPKALTNKITDLDGDTRIEVEVNPDDDTIRISSNGIDGILLHEGSLVMKGTTGATLVQGRGTRLMWIADKAAFRAGNPGFLHDSSPSNRWNADSIGMFSFVAGGETGKAYGQNSFVGGGAYGTASANYSFTGGGQELTASGIRSVAAGGFAGTASGENSFVGGGQYAAATADYSFIGGGRNAKAEGANSFVGGGWYGRAVGNNSFVAGGYGSAALGYLSFAGSGRSITAASFGEAAFGLFGTAYVAASTTAFMPADRIFSIGNGVDEDSRSNALTIFKNGNFVVDHDTVEGAGDRMMWIAEKAAFRAGSPTDFLNSNSTFWDIANVGTLSAVVGGEASKASGRSSFIGGGKLNKTSAGNTFVGGGENNLASSPGAFVGGGLAGTAQGFRSFVGAGQNNAAMFTNSFVGGGESDTASGIRSFIGGGKKGRTSANDAFIGGGENGLASGQRSFVGGGFVNTSSGKNSFTGGGDSLTAFGDYSFVGGGRVGYAGGEKSFVGGGENGWALGHKSFVGGGAGNLAWGQNSFTGGGSSDTATGINAFIGGGENGSASGDWAFIGGGKSNKSSGHYSFIGGGSNSAASSDYAFVGGGFTSTASGQSSFTGGGDNLTASGENAFVGGGYQSVASGLDAFVGGGANDVATGDQSFVAGGSNNLVSGQAAFIGGGLSNTAAGNISFIGGGRGLLAPSFSEAVFGSYNTAYVPVNSTLYSPSDRLFTIGNGTAAGNRSNALTILKNGNVAIGTDDFTGNYKLKVCGNIAATSATVTAITCASDSRFKKNILPLESSLALVQQLKGVAYQWNREAFPEKQFGSGSQIGFLAQDVEGILPELVTTGADGYKSVNYIEIIPILTEAIKEQQEEIGRLKSALEKQSELEEKLERIEAAIKLSGKAK